LSDIGRRRASNEDSTASDPTLGLLVVADGMGGYRSGEVASAIAVSSIVKKVRDDLVMTSSRAMRNGCANESSILYRAIQDANSRIFCTGQVEALCEGMGTTVVTVLFYGKKLSVGHVGDSRLYRLRDGTLEQLTSDHSVVQELIDEGSLSPEEAAAVPKNLLTRALGIDKEVDVEIHEDEVEAEDIYLLCTDGLYDMVSAEEIRLTLRRYSDNLLEAGERLVAQANEHGGKDNISVIIARPRWRFMTHAAWPFRNFKWSS
jgi:protein phosphatase